VLLNGSADLVEPYNVPQTAGGAEQLEIVAGKRAITVDTGLRLSHFFGMSEGFWCGLQLDYDAAVAKDALAAVLTQIQPLRLAA